ncbi:MAG TPA: hypothetical protein DHW45_09915, partial [Candidatus Latescibacteria bacterium]|nr:hypothetical protein [Candidatus Latescibacterota bacterium]
ETERTREAFFSMIRHELKRPLHTIDRYLNAQSPDGGVVSHAQSASSHLGSMIDDLLLLARLDRDPLAVQPMLTVTVGELVSGWDLSYRGLADEKEITLRMSVEDDRVSVRIDERRFLQAVGNVIDNAVKFTPRTGTIELRAEREDSRLRILVDDSGPGIPLELREQVFHRFYQASDGTGRPEGLGLGLAITAGVVAAHGGRVTISDSALGGARFALELPVAE